MSFDVQTFILFGSLAIIALVVLWLGIMTIGAARQRGFATVRQRLSNELLQERIKAAQAATKIARDSDLAWSGFRKFEVQRKVMEGGDICSFYLVPHDRKPLPGFRPGQYLTFQLSIAGQGKPTIRCYSLSDAPGGGRDYYRVSIKRLLAPRDKPEIPPGLSSNFFHQQIDEGDILDVKAPAGHFHLDLADDRPVVLIGGGVGITPVLSMLNAIVENGSRRETWFFYGVRSKREHIMAEHLRDIAQKHDHVRLQICYSDPAANEVAGKDYHHSCRVSVDLFKKVLPSSNYQFYICGPPPMMDSLVHGLEAWGVPKDHIHFEAFGPATVKRAAAAVAPTSSAAPGIEVRFGRAGKACQWSAAAGSLLELAEANGVNIDFGCRAGNCGTCLTAIKSGQVEYTQAPGATPEEGSCLACIAVPKGPLVLDA